MFLANRMAFESRIGSSGRKVLENIDPQRLEEIEAKTGLTAADLGQIQDQLQGDYELNGSNLVSEIN